MNGTRTLVVATALLAMFFTCGWAATLEVSQPVQVTSDSYYERGQAIVYDGTNYWLFYGRSASCTDPYSSGTPDIHDYAIYYKKAATVPGLISATATAVPGATNCYLGETGAAVVDGKVWTFGTVPSLNFAGQKSLYGWYTTDGSSWIQVADLWDDMSPGSAHHDEAGFDGKLYIMANHPESYTGWYSKYTDDPTAGTITWSTPIPLNSTANLVNGTGHFYAEGTSLYIGILRTNPSKDNKVLEYVASPEEWTELCTAVSSGWDGTLFKVGTDYVYAQAPWADPGKQYIIAWSGTSPSNVLSGSSYMVCEGKYGSNEWVDMWPIGFTDNGGTSYLFYTSERDNPAAEGVGNIWYLEVDWTVSNDHYTYMQEAIDAAVSGDAIDVGAGTYAEYLHITTDDLTVEGAGIDQSIVDLDGLMPYWHYDGCSSSYASRAGVLLSGYGSPDEIVEDVVLRGFTVKNAGLNPPGGGSYAEYVDPGADGQDDVRGIGVHNGKNVLIENCKVQYSGYNGFGAGKARCTSLKQSENITIKNCVALDNCSTGIVVGDHVGFLTITGNVCTNNKMPWAWSDSTRQYAGKGIEVVGGSGAKVITGLISGNTCTANGYQGITLKSYSDGVVVENNTITGHNLDEDGAGIFFYAKSSTPANCVNDTIRNNVLSGNIRGIVGYYAQNALIEDNTISTASGAFDPGQEGIKLDGCNGCLVADNTLTDCDGTGIKAQNTWDSVECHSNTVTGNTITNANGPGIRASSGSHDNTFEGNTINGADFAGIFIYLGAYDNTFTDNLVTGVTTETFYAGEDYEVTQGDGIFMWGYNGDFDARAGTGNTFLGNGVYGNAEGGIENQVDSMIVDASGNWWGSTVAATVATGVGSYVDYTPWAGGGTPTSPGYACDYSSVYVDDDSPQTGSTDLIQEGVDLVSGSTLRVAAGTYAEHVTITKTLDLLGPQAGVDPTAAGARTSEVDEAIIDITGLAPNNPNVAVEIPDGVTGVTVSGLTIKGSPTSHYADESDIRCWDDNITVSENILEGWLGVLCKGADGQLVDRSRMVVNKNGVVVQPNTGMAVTVSNNNITLGSAPGGDESGIYVTDCSDVLISGNTVNGFVNAKGVVGSNVTDIDIAGNTLTGNKDAISFWGTTTFIDITGNVLSDNLRYGVSIKGQDVDISNNVIERNGDIGVNIDRHVLDTERVAVNFNSLVGNTNYGIFVDTGDVTETVDGEMNWWGDASGPNTSKGSGDRVSAGVDYDPWIGKDPGGENIVCDPDPDYLSIADQLSTIDVDYLGGGGGLMYGYNVKVSWDTMYVRTTPGDITQGTLLSSVGGTFWNVRSTGDGEITVDCILLGAQDGVTGPGEMFSIDFHAKVPVAYGVSPVDITVVRIKDKDNVLLSGFSADDGEIIVDTTAPSVSNVQISNNDLMHTNDYIKDGDWASVDATVTDAHPDFDGTNIVADLSGLGEPARIADGYISPGANWILHSGATCTPTDGTITVTVTATDAHGNTASAFDTIIADNTAPAAVTAFDAAPGNQECDLSWTNGTDTYYEGTVVRRADVTGEYPQYPWFVGNWPSVVSAYPTDEADGTGVYDDTGTSCTDAVAARNIYYYQAFSYDWARNYGPAATTARDLATNYWLGDVSDVWAHWGYDGEVDQDDILKLSDVYGTVNPVGVGEPNGDAECDIGPTVHPDWHRLGLPLPDNTVEFEDAMIFAMNYGVVAAKVVPFLPEEYSTDVLALTLSEREMVGSEVDIALRLEGNTGDVKGVSAAVVYDHTELEFISARLSADMSSPLADVFFWSGTEEGRVVVDALVLGTDVTIGGSGDVAVLTFRVLGDGYALEVESARIRDADNTELDARLGDYASGGEMPLVFRLVQNAPNPFNPVTKVAYHVPRESRVTIRVYDVSGRVVRTLLDGVVEPGRHAAVWNGRNDAGETVGSGIYFCTMEAPDFHDSRKMTLLK